ncbi:MAG: amidohydrolase family protein [Kiritimatiellae bacterium]|nr:amidohydrolase family protein [Kiritimatiellia bacterium]
MIVIVNGTVIDGSGGPAFAGDVAVDGDRITDVVRRGGGPPPRYDAETVDAAGCAVTPGFIDAHTHSDAYLLIEPDAPSKTSQGVTTEINGQCGGSAAPRYGEARLSSDWAALLGDRLIWRSLAEYRGALAAAKPAVNTVQFVGHNTLRASVVGYAGRAATADEIRRMCELLGRSLDEGGWGLSTGLIYQPGKYATREEVEALASAAAAHGAFYATHMRSEGDGIEAAIDEVIDLVKATGVRAEISHLKTSGRSNWGKIDAVLEKIEGAVAAGLLLGSDRYPYCAAGTDLDIVLPDWAQEGGAPAELARLEDSAQCARIAEEIDASGRDWKTVMIGGTWSGENRRYSGRLVSEILAGGDGAATPGEFVCGVLRSDGCRTGAFFFGMSEENLSKIYSRPWVVPGSDASLRAPWGPLGSDHPHPRAYATMPEFYRRVRSLGFSREETVRRMTSTVADRFGLIGRGRLKKGAFADIVVWNESEFRGNATYSSPHLFSGGVKLTMVNGAVCYRDGAFTGVRGGRFLER